MEVRMIRKNIERCFLVPDTHIRMTFFVSPKPQERHDSEGRNPLRKRRLKTRTEQRQQRRFFSMQICVSIATNKRMRGYKYESLIENAKTKILSGLFIKEEERLNNC